MIKKNLFFVCVMLLISSISFGQEYIRFTEDGAVTNSLSLITDCTAENPHTYTVTVMNLPEFDLTQQGVHVAWFKDGQFHAWTTFTGNYVGATSSITRTYSESFTWEAKLYYSNVYYPGTILDVTIGEMELNPFYTPDFTSFGFSNNNANGEPPYSYTWEYSDCLGNHEVSIPTINPANLSSQVQLTVTDANGCVANWTGGNPVPQLSINVTTTDYLLYRKYVPSISSGLGGIGGNGPYVIYWNWNSGSSNNEIINLSYNATNISLYVIDRNGCTKTWFPTNKSKNRSVNASINENTEVSIYPNPASSTLNIETPSNEVSIEVHDIASQKVLEAQNTKSIDISHLENGNYIIKITSQGETTIKKFVKQ